MKLAVFICETRKIDLIKIINDHLKFLPKDVDLYIYHGRSNRFLKTIFPSAHFTELDQMNERIYNELLTSPGFWERFLEYERVLIFQHDSGILKEGIEEFMEMDVDYLGSPWLWQERGFNGGISLRNPKIMYEICQKFPYNITYQNEDVYFSNIMINHDIGKLATREQGMKWGVEAVMSFNTFCYHAIEKWHSKEICDKILNQYK